MLSKSDVLDAVQSTRESGCIDYRDYARLLQLYDRSEWHHFGFTPHPEDGEEARTEWTRRKILNLLASDVNFGFYKALNKRSISSSLMYHVIKMWMWILEDELQDFDLYRYYGLPLLRQVALRYDLPNPIGDDLGEEPKYR